MYPQAGYSLCCAETVSSRKLKLNDSYKIFTSFNFEYKLVSLDIHCCHGNVIVEECGIILAKSKKVAIFGTKSFSNFNVGFLCVTRISKSTSWTNFKQIGWKTKKFGFSTFFLPEQSSKYKMMSSTILLFPGRFFGIVWHQPIFGHSK